MRESILFICAHNDDQIIGGGGTFARYANEGKRVKTIVFSYGEQSHPHLKPQIVVKMRVKEAKKSDAILGGKGILFLGLHEGKFKKEAQEKNVKEHLLEIIRKEKPSKIFTHSPDDFHHDHRAVHRIVRDMIKEHKIDVDVYTFDVWNPIKILKRNVPKLVVDISDTFATKMKAYEAHESQVNLPGMLPFRLRMWVDAVLYGWSNHCKYAELFYKL